MSVFIAGATMQGLCSKFHALNTLESKLSQTPVANFPKVFAERGATRSRSASSLKSACKGFPRRRLYHSSLSVNWIRSGCAGSSRYSTPSSPFRSHPSLSAQLLPSMFRNYLACCVVTITTSSPTPLSSDASPRHLIEATDPVAPSITFFLVDVLRILIFL